jgi:hypothetical protein
MIVLVLSLAAAPAAPRAHAAPMMLCSAARATEATPVFAAAARRRPIGRLAEGMVVYACETRGDWIRIYYGPPGPCGAVTAGGLDGRKTLSCHSGWVRRSGLDLLAE